MQAAIEQRGGRVPVADVPDWLEWVWRAWHRLSADRPWRGGGFGPSLPGAIPWGMIRDWCDHHGYGPDELAFMDGCFREMDAVHREWLDKQRPKP